MYGTGIRQIRNKQLSNRGRRKLAETAIKEAGKAIMVLLAVLAQGGGSITVDARTLREVGRNLNGLDFEITDGPDGSSIVRLVDGGTDGRGQTYGDVATTIDGPDQRAGDAGSATTDAAPGDSDAVAETAGASVATDRQSGTDGLGERSGLAADGGVN